MQATRPFAVESISRSWWSVVSTFGLVVLLLISAAFVPWWPLRLACSVVGGLVMVRSFILYHDFMHRSLLRDSRIVRPMFDLVGFLMLTPPRHWRQSHNFHHGNVGKPLPDEDHEKSMLVTSDIGSFPLMTTEAWQTASFWQRMRYRMNRSPITLLLAYITVFGLSTALIPFLKDPKKNWDGGVSILVHGGVVAGLWIFAGFDVVFFAFILPFSIAAAMGAYLFYAQHNYQGMRILEPDEWTYYLGATESSSYMKLGPIMSWFTGNIGYHHVHHLNPLIPFYRLPETMAALPELQGTKSTSLWPHDILSCLRLNLWDQNQQTLVTYGLRTLGRHSAY